ncbi:MAG: hypothetical protein J6P03_00525 [Opitutales bacterium]|nr:hypothetical protein [Opitutales bacterium]
MSIDEIINKLTADEKKLLIAFSHENLPHKELINPEDKNYFNSVVYFPWLKCSVEEYLAMVIKLDKSRLIDMIKIPANGNLPIPKITTEYGDWVIENLNDEAKI